MMQVFLGWSARRTRAREVRRTHLRLVHFLEISTKSTIQFFTLCSSLPPSNPVQTTQSHHPQLQSPSSIFTRHRHQRILFSSARVTSFRLPFLSFHPIPFPISCISHIHSPWTRASRASPHPNISKGPNTSSTPRFSPSAFCRALSPIRHRLYSI